MLKAMSQFPYFLNFVRRLRRIFIEYLVEVEMIIFFFFWTILRQFFLSQQ